MTYRDKDLSQCTFAELQQFAEEDGIVILIAPNVAVLTGCSWLLAFGDALYKVSQNTKQKPDAGGETDAGPDQL